MKEKTEHSQYVSNDMSKMSDNTCISHLPTAVPAYWDPGGLASLIINEFYSPHQHNYMLAQNKLIFTHMLETFTKFSLFNFLNY